MPNYNEQTGIRFGVHGPNGRAQEIINDVFENGTNLGEKRWREDVWQTCESNREVDYRKGETALESLDYILSGIQVEPAEVDHSWKEEMIDTHYDYDYENGWWDVSALCDDIIEHAIQEHGVLDHFDENPYIMEYAHHNAKTHQAYTDELSHGEGACLVRINWLGGAPHLWVIRSTHVVDCRQCSPCIPEAGDLDSACDPNEANAVAYCIPSWLWIQFDTHRPDGYLHGDYRTEAKAQRD